jgi:NTE family protein
LPRPVGFVLGGGASLGAIQVGMLQALSEVDIGPDSVAGTSVGALNGAVVALDPAGAANRLSHVWARTTRDQIFPGGAIAQARTLQQTKTHLFRNAGLAAVIEDFLDGADRFEDLCLPFTAVTMDCHDRARASDRSRSAPPRAAGEQRRPGHLSRSRARGPTSLRRRRRRQRPVEGRSGHGRQIVLPSHTALIV